MNVDTPLRTLLVAACVALGCSVLVATAVYLLRPLQQNDSLLARNRVIVDAAGNLPDGLASDADVMAAYLSLDTRIAVLGTSELRSEAGAQLFDHWQQPDDNGSMPVLERRAPVYLKRHQGKLERVVFPVHGAGMWSTIYAYLALEPDLATIADIVFLRHGETPGVGDRIEEPAWRREWRGKKLFDEDGKVRLRVVRDARNEYEIDLISGASVTCEAVGDLVISAFDENGYGPLVQKLRREGMD